MPCCCPRSASTHQVVAGILRAGDLVLLCHRAPDRRWYPDVWDLPGGHVEPGEDDLDALRRELREELGVEVSNLSSDPVTRIDGDDFALRVYVVHAWDGRVSNCSPDEHDRIGWFCTRTLGPLEFAHPALPLLLRELSAGQVT